MLSSRIFATLVAALLLIAPLCAQESEGQIAHFIQVKPKAGMSQELEEAAKAHMDWHRQQNDSWEWHLWQYVTGEQLGQYLALTPGHRWEDFDAKQEFIARDQADAATRIGPFMESMSAWYSRFRPEISSWSEDDTPSMVHVTVYHVKPGKTAQFTYAVERLHKALQQAGWPQHYMWEQVVVGGEGPVFNLVLPMQKWADLNPPEKPFDQAVEEVVGRREAESLLQSFLETIQGQRSEILRYRPDLSYIPDGQ